MAILNKLEWNLSVPTHYVFLSRFARAAASSSQLKNDEEVKNTYTPPYVNSDVFCAIKRRVCVLKFLSMYECMQMENMVFFFAELALLQYALVPLKPSMVAAAAVYAARLTLKKTPLWTETLKHHTGYT